MECLSCGNENPQDAQFCLRCGTRLAVVCPACRQELPAEARFCFRCGAPVGSADTRAPSSQPTPQPAPTIPDSFGNGRYQVRRFLGEGGKKKVYLVHDTLLDRDVAFSLIKTEGLDEVGTTRIKREAQLMGRLGGHPHIVSVYDMGQEGEQPYLVSELMGGGDVEGLIEQASDHRPPLTETLRIGDEVCQALEHAHGHGIIHRDLKPGNVWLTKNGTAKLGDFGLAMALDKTRLSMAGMIVGTVGYMPPEQALGRQPDARSDLYSLGAMLYEMVTGRPPFLGDDAVAVIGQHINIQPVAPSWHNPAVPRALESLILGLLAKDPAQRPVSAAAVRHDLAGIAPTAPAPTSTEQRRIEAEANPLDRLVGGVFVGREKELAAARAALDGALAGRGQVLLAGEPGIGKTRLAEELGTYAGMRGAQVRWGRCDEWAGAPAYWPWVQIIRAYVQERDPQALRSELGAGVAEVAQVVSEVREKLPGLPELPPMGPEQARFRLFDGVATFLRNASRHQPLVLVLDELQWADESSLLLLQLAAKELRAARVLLVGAYRDVEVGRHHPLAETLAELAREPRMQRLVLRGLTAPEIARYLELTVGTPPPPALVEAVQRETEGNPFFLTEVVRLLAAEGALDRPTDRSRPIGLPQGVREVVGRRLDRLSEACNQVLAAASAIGRDFALDVLAVVTELPADNLLDLLAEAERARVVRATGAGRYRFGQELIQETLYDEFSPSRRARLHAEVGEALERLHAADLAPHFAALAHHFALAAPVGTADKAVAYARQAGDRAMAQLAWEAAVAHYEQALQALDLRGPADKPQRCELLLALGHALNVSTAENAPPRTRPIFREAADVARRLGAAEQLARAALGFAGMETAYTAGGVEQVELLEEALAALDLGDSVLRARLLARLSADYYRTSPATADRARAVGDEAVAMARRLDDPATLGFALRARTPARWRPGNVEERLAEAAEIIELAKKTGDVFLPGYGYIGRSITLMELGDVAAADRASAHMAEVARALRMPIYDWRLTMRRALRALMDGRFAEV